MKKKFFNLRILLITSVILFTWLGIVRNLVSFRLGGIVFGLISVILMVLSLFLKNKNNHYFVKEREIVVLVLIFSFLYFSFSFLYKSGHFTEVLGIRIPVYSYNTLLNVPLWIANSICFLRSDKIEKKYIFKLINLVLIYDLAITIFALANNSDFAKARSAGILEEASSKYAYLGAMGYELTYSVLLLVPLYFYLGVKKKQWLCLLISGLSLVFVFMSSFFIAVISLILLCAISLVFALRNRTMRALILFLSVMIVLFFVSSGQLGNVFIWLSHRIDSYELSQRFLQVGNLLSFGDSSGRTLMRLELYNNSVNAISIHPIFGVLLFNSYYPISDHSTLLDVWAGFGIIMFLLFISIPLRIISLFSKTQKSRLAVLMICSVLAFVFISAFNQIFISPHILLVVTFILPLINSIHNKRVIHTNEPKNCSN